MAMQDLDSVKISQDFYLNSGTSYQRQSRNINKGKFYFNGMRLTLSVIADMIGSRALKLKQNVKKYNYKDMQSYLKNIDKVGKFLADRPQHKGV